MTSDYPDGQSGNPMCAANSSDAYCCTRDLGHEGKHAAYGFGVDPIEVWK